MSFSAICAYLYGLDLLRYESRPFYITVMHEFFTALDNSLYSGLLVSSDLTSNSVGL